MEASTTVVSTWKPVRIGIPCQPRRQRIAHTREGEGARRCSLLHLCLHLRHPHLVISNMQVEILSFGLNIDLNRLAACTDGNLPAHTDLRCQGIVFLASANEITDLVKLRRW